MNEMIQDAMKISKPSKPGRGGRSLIKTPVTSSGDADASKAAEKNPDTQDLRNREEVGLGAQRISLFKTHTMVQLTSKY